MSVTAHMKCFGFLFGPLTFVTALCAAETNVQRLSILVQQGTNWTDINKLESVARRFAEQRDTNFNADHVQTSVWIYQSTNSVQPFLLVSYGTEIAKPFWNVYLAQNAEILQFETGLLSERVFSLTNRPGAVLNDNERKSRKKKRRP